MKRTLLVVAVAMVLTGCGEPKIDGKSESSLQASIAKVAESLPESRRKEFSDSVMVLTMSGVNFGDLLSGKRSIDALKGDVLVALNGKTASQVIEEASKVRTEREVREKQQALDEVGELLGKKAAANKDKAELAKFVVSKSRFSIREEKYSSQGRPIIEITVANGTSHSISRAYFRGTIASPGRSVPWFSGDFNYDISGGLEPGEKADWTLAPNSFSGWGKVSAPADAVLTVEVVRVDGSDNKALFDSRGFSAKDVSRLEALQKKYSAK